MSQVSSKSAFNEIGLKNSISQSIEHVKKLYVSDSIPWVIGYSGGKDSTATLQLIWYALQELAKEGKANKQVNVISTDTLVENPVVSSWVNKSLEKNAGGRRRARFTDSPSQAHSRSKKPLLV